jgi:spore germination protein KC
MVVLCGGCFGSRDLDQRAFIMAIAFDPAEEGKEGYKVTVQIPVPARMSPEGGGSGKTFHTTSVTATTVGAAMIQLQRRIDRELFIGHTRQLLFSDQLAKTKGIEDILDFFKRDFRFQRVADLAVVQGEAGKVLEMQPPLEQNAATYIENVLVETSGSGFHTTTDLGEYLVIDADEGIEPVLPRLMLKEKELITGGAAILCGGKLVGWLTPAEALAYTILRNEFRFSRYVVNFPGRPGEKVTVRIRNARSKHKVEIVGGKLHVLTKITGGFEALEFIGNGGPSEWLIPRLEQEVSEKVAEGIRAALRKSQALNADIVGYGRMLRAKYPEYWDQVDWTKVYPRLKIKVAVDIQWTQTIRRPGR